MKIALIGFGSENKAFLNYTRKTHKITICDQDESLEVPAGAAARLGASYLRNLDEFDLIVCSPGVHPEDAINENPGVSHKITNATNEFFKLCPTRNIIGVTGTKGKGTTCTLIAKMLEAAGKQVFLGGNIGISPFSFIDKIQPDDWVVMELSSFQLMALQQSPKIAVCLLVVPEHLDWHQNMDEYMGAKANLFRHQKKEDVAIYFAQNETSKHIASMGNGQKLPYFENPGAYVEDDNITIAGQNICRTDELNLLGKHNWQNVCAAVTVVWQVTQDVAAIRSVLCSFSGLPHRIEFVREVSGVRYYNDSFASGLHATVAAAHAVAEPKVLVIGGYDRMLPLDGIVDFLHEKDNRITSVLLIGASKERVAQALTKAKYTDFTCSSATDMMHIVADATKLAKPGEAILFSPGFPSFDMFKNFEDRGEKFKAAVKNL